MDETSTLSKIRKIKKSLEYHHTVLQNIRLFKLFSKFISIIIALALCYSAVQNNCTVFLALTSIAVAVFFFAFKVVFEDVIFLRKDFKELTSIIDTISDRLKGKTCNQTKEIEECLNQTEYDKSIFSYLTEQMTWNAKCDGLILLSNTVCLCLIRLNDDNIYILLVMQILIIISIVISALEYVFLIKRTQKHEELRETFKKFIPFTDDDTHMGDRSKDYKGELVTGNFRIEEHKSENFNDDSLKRTTDGNIKLIEGIKNDEGKRQVFQSMSSASPEDDNESFEYGEGKEEEIQSLPENSKVKKQQKAIEHNSSSANGKLKKKRRRNKKSKNNENDKKHMILGNVKDNQSVTDEQSNDATNLLGTTAEKESEGHVSTVKSHSPQTPEKTEDASDSDWQTVPCKSRKERQKSEKKKSDSTLEVDSNKEIINEEESIKQHDTTTNVNNNIENIENIAEQKDKTVGDSELTNKANPEELRKVLNENDIEKSKDNASEKLKGQRRLSPNLECKNEQKYSENSLEIKSKELQNDQTENEIATDDELSKNSENATNFDVNQFTIEDTNTAANRSPESSDLKDIPAVSAAKRMSGKQPNAKHESADCRTEIALESSNIEELSSVDATEDKSDVRHPIEDLESSEDINRTGNIEGYIDQKGSKASEVTLLDNIETTGEVDLENKEINVKVNNDNVSGKELQIEKNESDTDEGQNEIAEETEYCENDENATNVKPEQSTIGGQSIIADNVATDSVLKGSKAKPPADGSEGMNGVKQPNAKQKSTDCRTEIALESSNIEEVPSVDANVGKSDVRHPIEDLESSEDINRTGNIEGHIDKKGSKASEVALLDNIETTGEVDLENKEINVKVNNDNVSGKENSQIEKNELYADEGQNEIAEEPEYCENDENATNVKTEQPTTDGQFIIADNVATDSVLEGSKAKPPADGSEGMNGVKQLNTKQKSTDCRTEIALESSNIEEVPSVDTNEGKSDVRYPIQDLESSEDINRTGNIEGYIDQKGSKASEVALLDNIETTGEVDLENKEINVKVNNDNVSGKENLQIEKNELYADEGQNEIAEETECFENDENAMNVNMEQSATDGQSIIADNVATDSVLERPKATPPVDGSEGKSGAKYSNMELECTHNVTKTAENVVKNAGAIYPLEGMKLVSFNLDQMSSKEEEAKERSSTLEDKSTASQEMHRKLSDVYAASKNYSSSYQVLKKTRYYQLFLKLLSVIIAATLCISVIESMCIELLFLLSTIAVMSSLNIRILLRDLSIQSEDDDVLKSKSVSEVKFVEKCCLHNNTDILLLGRIKSLLEGKNINIGDRFSLKKFLLLVIIDEIALISNSLCFVACKLSSNCENLSIVQNLLMFSLVISATEYLIKRESYHGVQEKKSLEKSFKILMSLCSEQPKSYQTAETYAEDEEKSKKITANDLHANQTKPGFDYKIQAHQEEADPGSMKESEVLSGIKSSEEVLNEMYESIPDDAKERISQDESKTSYDAKERISQDDSKTSSLNSADKTFEGDDLSDKQDGKKLCRTSDSSTTDGVIGKIMEFGESLTAYIFKHSLTDCSKLNKVERANENDKIVNLHDIKDKEKFHCETDGVPADESNLTEDDTEKQTSLIDSNVSGEKATEHFFSPTVNISFTKNNGEDSTYSINNYEAENETSNDRESISKFYETQGLTNEELEMRKSLHADDSADQRGSSNKEEGNAQASTASYNSPESAGISDEHNISIYEIEKRFLDNIPEILNELRKLEETEMSIDDELRHQNLQHNSGDNYYNIINNLLSSLLSVLSVSCQRLCQLIFSSRTLENDGISNKQNSNKQSDESKSSEYERICYSLDEVKDTIDPDSETQNEPGCAKKLQNDGLKRKMVNLSSSLLSVLSLLCQRVHKLIFSRRMHENDGISNTQNKNKQDIENKSSESERICCFLDEVKDTIDYSETQDFQDSIGNHEQQNDELKDLFDHEPEVQNNQVHLSNEKNKDRDSSQKLTGNIDSSRTEAIDDVNITNENELLNAFDSLNNINRVDGETNGNLEASKSLINDDFRTKEFDHEPTFEVKKADEDLTSPEASPHSCTDIKHEHTKNEFSSVIESTNVVNQTEKGIKCIPKLDRSSETCTQKYQGESNAESSSTRDILNRTNYNERMSKFENHEVSDEKIERQNLVENKVSEEECHRSYRKKKSPDISEDVLDSTIAKGGKREVRANEKSLVMNKNGDGNSFKEEIGSKLTRNEEASEQRISSPNVPQTKHSPVGNFISKQNHVSQQVISTEAQPRKSDVKLSHGRFILGMQLNETADLSFSYSCARIITRDKCVSEHKFSAKSKRE